MRLFGALVLLVVSASFSGCTVPTTYSKSITVKKDASGKVLETLETATVVQSGGQGYLLRFENLKDVQPTYEQTYTPINMPRSR